MSSRMKKIAFSSVSVFIVLAMLAGITMAWFSDTEKTNANFHAGVLNMEVSADQANPETGAMEFENLRPMQMQAFHQELGDNFANRSTEGFDPVPKYFHPVTITNAGSLPAQVVLSVEDMGACDAQIADLTGNGNGGVRQQGTIPCADRYRLGEVLEIFVYQQTAGPNGETVWSKIEGVNLNTQTGGGAFQPYTADQPLGAGESVQYVVAGYLPESVGNAYQATHFHSNLVVGAGQADQGADIGGGTAPDPQPQEKFVTVEYVRETDSEVVGTEQVRLGKTDTTKQIAPADLREVPAGYELVPGQAAQTVTLADGVVTPESISFTVREITEKTVTVRFLNAESNNALVEERPLSLGTEQNSARTYTQENLAPPSGYIYIENWSQTVTVTDGAVSPESFDVLVKPENGGGPVDPDLPPEPENPDCDSKYPHILKTAEDLDHVRDHRGCNFVIANDIDLSTYEGSREWVPIGYVERKGNAWTGYTYAMTNPFTGTMDGYGHTITNLVVTSSVDSVRGNGLFGATTGKVSNLKIQGADVYGPAFVGVLAGANGGTIENCAVSGAVTAANNFGGGLAGWNLNGTITGCSSSAYVGGNLQPNYDGVDANMMGGLVGVNESGTISRCAATGDVNTKVTDRAIIDSNAYGEMTGYTHYENIGGLVGENYGTIRDCVASGSVKGYTQVGGLTSYNEGNISNCVAYAKVYSLVQNTYTNWQSPTVAAEYGKSDYTSIYFVKGNVYKNNVQYTGWDTKSRGVPMTEEEMTSGQALSNLVYAEPVWSFAAGGYPALIGLPAIS